MDKDRGFSWKIDKQLQQSRAYHNIGAWEKYHQGVQEM